MTRPIGTDDREGWGPPPRCECPGRPECVPVSLESDRETGTRETWRCPVCQTVHVVDREPPSARGGRRMDWGTLGPAKGPGRSRGRA